MYFIHRTVTGDIKFVTCMTCYKDSQAGQNHVARSRAVNGWLEY